MLNFNIFKKLKSIVELRSRKYSMVFGTIIIHYPNSSGKAKPKVATLTFSLGRGIVKNFFKIVFTAKGRIQLFNR